MSTKDAKEILASRLRARELQRLGVEPPKPKDDVPRYSNGLAKDLLVRLRERIEAVDGFSRWEDRDPEAIADKDLQAMMSRFVQLSGERERAEAQRRADSGEIAAPPPAPAGATDEELLELFRTGRLRHSEYRLHQGRIEAALRRAAIDDRISELETERARS